MLNLSKPTILRARIAGSTLAAVISLVYTFMRPSFPAILSCVAIVALALIVLERDVEGLINSAMGK